MLAETEWPRVRYMKEETNDEDNNKQQLGIF